MKGKGIATKAKSFFVEGWEFLPKKSPHKIIKMQRLFATKIQWPEAVHMVV